MSEPTTIEVRDSLADIEAGAWNALDHTGNPFLTHEFLHGLEATDCVGDGTGWYPRHFLLHDDDGGLAAAVPAYLKTHSYGEFVFDWSWAQAFEQHGLNYYPKLIVAIPFTPATGPRLLVRDRTRRDAHGRLLGQAVRQFADAQNCSSAHFLFLTDAEQRLLCGRTPDDARLDDGGRNGSTGLGYLSRLDCQYHWHNHDYPDFDAFLNGCTAKRRKTIRRERRYVAEAGLTITRRFGHTLDEREWGYVHSLYESTYDRKWGMPSLTLDFFRRMGETFGERTLIVFAHDTRVSGEAEPVACAILFRGRDTLYGRYWGCRRQYHSLHFEACYYQGIEHCIEHGIDRFEPGAQGEHKITRGFVPTLTRSAHHVGHPAFRDAIDRYLEEESRHVMARCDGLADLLPFRQELAIP